MLKNQIGIKLKCHTISEEENKSNKIKRMPMFDFGENL
jgi:hypothetical protein